MTSKKSGNIFLLDEFLDGLTFSIIIYKYATIRQK